MLAPTSFYHGIIDWAESEKRLKAFSKNNRAGGYGLFLVRKRERSTGSSHYVLSFMGYNGDISHFNIIQTPDNRLSLGGLLFNRLCELVTHYSSPGTSLLKNECLEYPVPVEQRMEEDNNEPLDELAQRHQSIESLRMGSRKHHYLCSSHQLEQPIMGVRALEQANKYPARFSIYENRLVWG